MRLSSGTESSECNPQAAELLKLTLVEFPKACLPACRCCPHVVPEGKKDEHKKWTVLRSPNPTGGLQQQAAGQRADSPRRAAGQFPCPPRKNPATAHSVPHSARSAPSGRALAELPHSRVWALALAPAPALPKGRGAGGGAPGLLAGHAGGIHVCGWAGPRREEGRAQPTRLAPSTSRIDGASYEMLCSAVLVGRHYGRVQVWAVMRQHEPAASSPTGAACDAGASGLGD